jgi:hypothetical protein
MMMVLWLEFAGKPELATFFVHHSDHQNWIHLNSINAHTPYMGLGAPCRRYIVVDAEALCGYESRHSFCSEDMLTATILRMQGLLLEPIIRS